MNKRRLRALDDFAEKQQLRVHELEQEIADSAAREADLRNRAEVAEARLAKINQLFNGGPDTVCRTRWRSGPGSDSWENETECVEVPMDDLREALE